MRLDSLLAWGARHRDTVLDLLRIYLGIGLLVRGLVFIADPAAFYGFLDLADPTFSAMVLAHYVTIAHLVGGLLLALGLLTRLAALIQVPILFGAVFFVHLGQPLAVAGEGLEFSVLVLLLLVMYTVVGSGRISLDHQLFVARPVSVGLEDEERVVEERIAELRTREAEQPELANPVRDSIAENPCIHDRSRDHPRVAIERDYGVARSLRFVTGTTVTPRRVIFRCMDCGGVVEVSNAPQDLQYYRYHEHKGVAPTAGAEVEPDGS